MKLHTLAETLWGSASTAHLNERSLPTLGGYMGQSLAGAIATSTHGTDFEIASLASMVQAIHLVGPGAEEYWLERPRTPVTTDRSLRENLPDWSNVINVIGEDAPFLAAVVSVGRCGVVYSYIIEVEPAFLQKGVGDKRESK